MALIRPAAVDPILEALSRAPLVRGLSAEQRAELDEDLEEIAAGRAVLTPHEDVPAALEAMSSQQ